MAEKVKNPVCMPNRATYHGNKKALTALVPQLQNVAMDMPRPRKRVGNISGVSTQMTAQIDHPRQPVLLLGGGDQQRAG